MKPKGPHSQPRESRPFLHPETWSHVAADAATIAQLETELAEVKAAISAALSAQSWEQGERSEARARLEALEAREGKLERKLARARRGGIRVRQVVPRD